MNKETSARRDVLKRMAAAGVVALPAAGTLWQGAAHAAGVAAYDPGARFDVAISEVELRRNPAGRMLMARIYQPKGAGPFRPFSICTAGPGTERTASPKSRWIARWPRVGCSSSPST
jgi:hypothetical protein